MPAAGLRPIAGGVETALDLPGSNRTRSASRVFERQLRRRNPASGGGLGGGRFDGSPRGARPSGNAAGARLGAALQLWVAGAVVLVLAGCTKAVVPPPPPPPLVPPPPPPSPAVPPTPTPPPPAAREERGLASWYGMPHHGRPTSSGERFDMNALTAAHRTLPLGTLVMVTNRDTGRSVEVRINDRGPFVESRVIDLSYAAARAIGALGSGVIPVTIRVVRLPPVSGPDGPRARETAQAIFGVQVGAYARQERAEEVRQALAGDLGIPAFLMETGSAGEVTYRVRAGSWLERARAEEAAERLRERGYSAIVIEY
jgi:rare lipoprotein A